MQLFHLLGRRLSTAPSKLTIDVISDVICPWCYIGKRRLEKALAMAGRSDAQVRWHAFELNPRMPAAGIERRAYRTQKFGSWERSLALDAQVAEAARGEGLEFALDRIERTPNTLSAHRLIRLAGEAGLQDAVVEALFRAYFSEGRDLCRPDVLVEIATGAGLDQAQAEALLASDDGLEEIRAEEAEAARIGVQGVPFFIVNQSLGLSGARGTNDFIAAFRQAGVASPAADDAGACNLEPGDGRPC